MELRHLRYFIAVAEEENVTRASARLHVSQPALSRQMRDLEDELGVSLFDRGAKSLRLTEAGRVFLDEARAVVQRSEAAIEAARAAAGGLSGELNVGYAPSLTVQILPRALRKCQTDFPGLRVLLHDLSTEEMLAGLREGTLQLALMGQPDRDGLRGLRFTELARYPICVALPPSHPLACSRAISIAEVADEPLIGYTRAHYPDYHASVEALFAGIARKPLVAEEHESFTSVLAAVEAGRGVAVVPSCMSCLVGPRLKIIPLSPAPAPIVVGAVCRKELSSPAVEKFFAAAMAPAA